MFNNQRYLCCLDVPQFRHSSVGEMGASDVGDDEPFVTTEDDERSGSGGVVVSLSTSSGYSAPPGIACQQSRLSVCCFDGIEIFQNCVVVVGAVELYDAPPRMHKCEHCTNYFVDVVVLVIGAEAMAMARAAQETQNSSNGVPFVIYHFCCRRRNLTDLCCLIAHNRRTARFEQRRCDA